MAQSAQLDQSSAEQLRTKLDDFVQTNRRALQITGLVAVAGATGALGGWLVVKGIAVGKGLAATNLTLATTGGVTAKAGAASLPALLAPQTTSTVGTVATNPAILNPATAAASLQGITNLLNNTATSGAALIDKVSALFTTLSPTVLPLAAGLVGGGAAGVGVAQRQVSKVQGQLSEQLLQTAALQSETAQMKSALSSTESKLSEIQATLIPPLQAAEPTPITTPEQLSPAPPDPAAQPSRQDRLEQINGIGPIFAQRLNEAGIYTIAALATQTPEALEAIIGTTRAGALFNPATWIAEAEQLAGEQENVVTKPERLAAPAVNTKSPATKSQATTLVLERLEAINGITSAIAASLNQAGILTYADLAAQTPTRVNTILGDSAPQRAQDVERWIAAAQSLVG